MKTTIIILLAIIAAALFTLAGIRLEEALRKRHERRFEYDIRMCLYSTLQKSTIEDLEIKIAEIEAQLALIAKSKEIAANEQNE